nr:unnamed protein product [Spirometra erinaceieuropaei]
MDDERLPKRLFYGDVATGSRRQGGQIRRYKDTLKSSLKRLQINPTNWEELALDRPTWRRTVKTGAAIYEANRIAAAKAKREARKSQLRPHPVFLLSLAPAIKLLLATACMCGILTSIAGLLICFLKSGQMNRRVLKKLRRRASGGASSDDAATAASATIRKEDGFAGDRTRPKQVFPTGLRLPLLRPLHQSSLHERIDRLTDLRFFAARRVQIGNQLYIGCHSRVYSGSISMVRFVDDASAPDNRVVLKTLPGKAAAMCPSISV